MKPMNVFTKPIIIIQDAYCKDILCRLFEFIQVSMSDKVLESFSSGEVEFEGVKEMYD